MELKAFASLGAVVALESDGLAIRILGGPQVLRGGFEPVVDKHVE